MIEQTNDEKKENFKEVDGFDISQILIRGTKPKRPIKPNPGGYEAPIKMPDIKERCFLERTLLKIINNFSNLNNVAKK